MSDDLSARIDQHFASLTDPRRGKVTYPLINIVTIALCAIIAGADDFVAIAAWARQKRAWLGPVPRPVQRHPLARPLQRHLPAPQARRVRAVPAGLDHRAARGHRRASSSPSTARPLRQSFDKADRQVGPPHGQRLGRPPTSISLGQVAVDREEQRDHRHPQAAGAAGAVRGAGDHRRHGLPGRDRREDRRGRRPTTCWPSRATSRRCTRGSWSSSWTTWRTTSPG